MSTTQNMIRPRAEYLAKLPTQAVQTSEDDNDGVAEYARSQGIKYRNELKLVRNGYRYWLVTLGVSDGANYFCKGHVIMEPIEPDENGECECWDYGPDDVTWLQGLDYFNALEADRERLEDEQEDEFTHEREAQIDAIQAELETVKNYLHNSPPSA